MLMLSAKKTLFLLPPGTILTDSQLVLVDVVFLLEDEVQVPHLDAPVDRAGEHCVLGGRHQGLDLYNPLNTGCEIVEAIYLEVCYEPVDQ